MRRIVVVVVVFILLLLVYFLIFNSKTISNFAVQNKTDGAVPDATLFSSAPVLTPSQAMNTFQLQEGFEIELVASEPLIQDPVAITFDDRGRIWVIEMQSYMLDIGGGNEDSSISRIVVLEDQNNDGLMDHSTVFLDSLIMPRAIALVNGGVLYAEPPNLWFVENNDDKPGNKILVDSTYALDGNVEHQPNGLMRGVDNWYYNAKSKKRYKFHDGDWIKQETEFRGQWGITMDDFGRLFYNTNSNQLRGDLVPPNALSKNPDFSPSLGINEEIVANQSVYPIRPTKGINRGYKEGMLNGESKLRQFTAACGPLIYRGDNFPQDFSGNAFVCEPAANLIKRNVLWEEGYEIRGKQAYSDEEFLASTDERFRPVSLNNAPDGSLYLVDMYRGIIQHETYLTDYLRDQIRSRNLDRPVGYGRIYRIVHKEGTKKGAVKNSKSKFSLNEASDRTLISYFSHPSGWWRDNAQRILIERRDTTVLPLLDVLMKEALKNQNHLHALWTLEGLGIYSEEIIKSGLQSRNPKVIATAIRIGESFSNTDFAPDVFHLYEQLKYHEDPLVNLQLALSLGYFLTSDADKVVDLLKYLAVKEGNDTLIGEAIISSLHGREKRFLSLMRAESGDHQHLISLLEKTLEKANLKKQMNDNALTASGMEKFLLGKPLYNKTCAGCHNENGEGLTPIAPPLAGSEWVTGPQERLVLIALHGLKGPVTVGGKVYKEPDVQSVMPGLQDNAAMGDDELAAILTYIRNAWGNKAEEVESSSVNEIRKSSMDRNEPYFAEELLE